MRLICLAMALFAGASQAADYIALPESTLGFSASFQGEVFDGRFAKFSPQIRFDPTQLGSSRFDVRITLTSANTRNDERDQMLRSVDFFDVARHPEARFTATRFRALGGNRYAADGSLSLHGASKPVVLAFTWAPGAKPVLVGEATLKRLDFGVGTGDWADIDLLPDAVKVKTRLVLAKATAAAPAKAVK